MAESSTIEWTDATWQPITGCSVVSPGCTHCYAMKLAGTRLQHHPSRAGLTRDSKAGPVWTGEVRLNEEWLNQPLRWKRPRRIFVCAHGDLFHESVPDEWIEGIFGIMAAAPQHTFQVLTKRAERMRRWMENATLDRCQAELCTSSHWPASDLLLKRTRYINGPWPLPNVWLGVSVEDQTRADERIPDLLATPAAKRFISAEPLLGPVDIRQYMSHNPVYGSDEVQRSVRLSAGDGGRFGNRARRVDMAAAQEGLGPLEADGDQSPVSEDPSRTRPGAVSASPRDAGREEGLCLGPSSGISPFQRTYPRWPDDQPQGWPEEKQPSSQLGIGDSFGATSSRGSHFESGPVRGPSGSEEPCRQADDLAGRGDQTTTEQPGAIGVDRQGLRDRLPNGVEDRERGSAPPGVTWCIVGGESGPGARPMHPDWARSLRDQCAAAGVPFFWKQWGEWAPDGVNFVSHTNQTPGTITQLRTEKSEPFAVVAWRRQSVPKGSISEGDQMRRVGKKAAGRLLDGREHNGMPPDA